MAVPPAKRFDWVQDVAPKGGFPKMGSLLLPKIQRAPKGWVLVGGAVVTTLVGLWLYKGDDDERKYRALAKFNERFERAYVLQAIEEASWQRRHKAMIDVERSWMADHPDWVVNKSFFYTKRQERPHSDPLDPRVMSPWGSA